MTHKVKKCASCGAINPSDEVLCEKCSLMLPSHTIDLDGPATGISFDAPTPRPKPKPAATGALGEAAKTHIPKLKPQAEARPWPYEPVPARLVGAKSLRVTLVGLDIGFLDLMWLLVQLIIAAIPAIIIAAIIFWGVIALLGLFFKPFF